MRISESKTIMIADDEIYMRTLLRTILERAGYKVIEACDGDDAVQKFAANAAEIKFLVLDVKMPGKTGREAYTEMKKIKPGVALLMGCSMIRRFPHWGHCRASASANWPQ